MFDARTTETWKMNDFLQKVKKMVGISQSDCRETVSISCHLIIGKFLGLVYIIFSKAHILLKMDNSEIAR